MTVVQITRVRPHGPADAAGAEARDRILRVDGMDVRARATRRSARPRSRAARPSILCAAQVSSLAALAAILQMRRPVRSDAALRPPARPRRRSRMRTDGAQGEVARVELQRGGTLPRIVDVVVGVADADSDGAPSARFLCRSAPSRRGR